MRARWAMATCMAIVAFGCAMQGTMFLPDHQPAVEGGARRSSAPQSRPEWRDRFDVNKADLLPTGTNVYITMQPGRVLRFKSGIDTLTITVLPDTQEIDGITTGILEERETKNGTLDRDFAQLLRD